LDHLRQAPHAESDTTQRLSQAIDGLRSTVSTLEAESTNLAEQLAEARTDNIQLEASKAEMRREALALMGELEALKGGGTCGTGTSSSIPAAPKVADYDAVRAQWLCLHGAVEDCVQRHLEWDRSTAMTVYMAFGAGGSASRRHASYGPLREGLYLLDREAAAARRKVLAVERPRAKWGGWA
jgi:hypothetical protein